MVAIHPSATPDGWMPRPTIVNPSPDNAFASANVQPVMSRPSAVKTSSNARIPLGASQMEGSEPELEVPLRITSDPSEETSRATLRNESASQ
jgi:hypothetical protein